MGLGNVTEALAQSVTARVVTVTEYVKQNGLLGLAHGLECAFLEFIVQPVIGALCYPFVARVGRSDATCFEASSELPMLSYREAGSVFSERSRLTVGLFFVRLRRDLSGLFCGSSECFWQWWWFSGDGRWVGAG
ncbi:uncharacterized protein LOC126660429 [Mercurialis annua]|uniref:uncharacterized protein LOC126660429 n=1 Tax=Mercurialis annua TaxID=3986 RepID=UPI00215FA8F0|nr:uncharacterized protein LOC126660429 [Mercurialis annua]